MHVVIFVYTCTHVCVSVVYTYRLIDITHTYIRVTYLCRFTCMRIYIYTSLAPADSWRPALCVLMCVYVCVRARACVRVYGVKLGVFRAHTDNVHACTYRQHSQCVHVCTRIHTRVPHQLILGVKLGVLRAYTDEAEGAEQLRNHRDKLPLAAFL